MMALWNVFDKAERLRNLIYKSRLKPIFKFNSWSDRNQVVLKYSYGYVRVFFHVLDKNLEPYCESCGLNKCSHILDAIARLENDETIQDMNPFVRDHFLDLLEDYLNQFENSKRETIFYLNIARGDSVRDVVRSLLERATYSVFLVGKENILGSISQVLIPIMEKCVNISKMPDLLVDGQLLLEVKFRNHQPRSFSLKYSEVKPLLQDWPQAFLVAVVPNGKVFYVAKVADLKEKMGHDQPDIIFDLTKAPWKPIEEVFIKIKQNLTLDDLGIFRGMVKVVTGIMG